MLGIVRFFVHFVFAFSMTQALADSGPLPNEKNIAEISSKDGVYLEALSDKLNLNKEYPFEFGDQSDDQTKGYCWFELLPRPDPNLVVPLLNQKIVIGNDAGLDGGSSPIWFNEYSYFGGQSEVANLVISFLSDPIKVNTWEFNSDQLTAKQVQIEIRVKSLHCNFEKWKKGPHVITVGDLKFYLNDFISIKK